MKLEVPNNKIMAGDAGYLSAPAAKLLLILIGCQDNNSLLPIVTESKTALASKCKCTSRQVFRLLTELEEQNWITRKGTIIIIKSELSTMSQPMTRDVTESDKALSYPKMSHTVTRDVILSDKAVSYDPILDLKEEDQITIDDLIPIAELYNLNSRQMNALLKELQGKSREKLQTLFKVMQRKEIDKPLAYIRKSMSNPGQELFKAMIGNLA
jgi:hypothetical protein